jgi:hypothetical protein
MANITISVQSFLNASRNLSITIDNAQTVAQLKTAINVLEGTPTAIMELYFGSTKLSNASTLASYSIVTGSYIKTSNNLTEAGLWTKQQRQTYKLQLAGLKRQLNSNARYTLDITQLPTQYSGNNVIDNPNVGGLIQGRPWV